MKRGLGAFVLFAYGQNDKHQKPQQDLVSNTYVLWVWLQPRPLLIAVGQTTPNLPPKSDTPCLEDRVHCVVLHGGLQPLLRSVRGKGYGLG